MTKKKKKKKPITSEENEANFQFQISKNKDESKPNDQTEWHKVNDFDLFFVSKCLHISNSMTKATGLDFQ